MSGIVGDFARPNRRHAQAAILEDVENLEHVENLEFSRSRALPSIAAIRDRTANLAAVGLHAVTGAFRSSCLRFARAPDVLKTVKTIHILSPTPGVAAGSTSISAGEPMSTARKPNIREYKGSKNATLATHRRREAAAMRASGASNAEIAHALSVHPWTVAGWFSETDVCAEVEALQSHAANAARKVLATGAEEAARLLVRSLSDTCSASQLRAALAILDRVGVCAPAQVVEERDDIPLRSMDDTEFRALAETMAATLTDEASRRGLAPRRT
jgi:hypothetical protein